MLWIRLFWLLSWLFASTAVALAADPSPIAECDRLAAEPAADGSGVPFDHIDAAAASAACQAAIEVDPAAPRLKHEYARALERAGNLKAAERLYRWAADDGLEAARQALTRLAGTANPAGAPSGATSPPVGEAKLAAFITGTGDDPAALSGALGKDIAFEIYRGALRRPAMTLYLRSGNATDQARLLAALIRKARPDAEFRFARCTLKAGIARAIVEHALTEKLTRMPLLIEQADEAAKSEAADAPSVQAALKAMAASWRDLTTAAEQESEWLAETLRAHGVVLHPIGDGELVSRTRDHFWVQIKDDGRWQDLDPSMKRAVDPADDCEDAAEAPASLDDQEYRLTLELIRDERENGTIVQHSQLKETLPFSAIPPTGLSLVFAEPWGIDTPENPAGDDDASFIYTPVVLAGSSQFFGKPFTLPRPTSAPKGLRSGPADALGGALAAFSEEPAEPPPAQWENISTVALRLIATLSGPGMKPKQLRQVIFDRRTGGEGSEGADGLGSLAPLSEVGGEYAILAAVTNISTAMSASSADITLPDEPDAAALRDTTFNAIAVFNSRYEAIRQAIFAAVDEPTTPTIATVPSLSILRWSARAEKGGSPVPWQSVNVLRAGDGVLPVDGAPASHAVRWAVASVLAERFLADPGSGSGEPETSVTLPRHHDIVALFQAARDASVPFALVSGSNSDMGNVQASAKARSLMRERLEAGDALLMPTSTPNSPGETGFGWWVVDGARGTLVDELADGTHAAAGEHVETDIEEVRASRTYCLLQGVVGSVMMVAAMTLAAPTTPNSVQSPDIATKLAKAGKDMISSAADAEKKRKAFEKAARTACKR